MNNRTEQKLTDLSGMEKAVKDILKQAWIRGIRYGIEQSKEDIPKGDLISREDLKEEIVKLCERINANDGITVPTLAFTRIIDNAPTVSDRYEEGYAQGYIDGSTGADWKGGAE